MSEQPMHPIDVFLRLTTRENFILTMSGLQILPQRDFRITSLYKFRRA